MKKYLFILTFLGAVSNLAAQNEFKEFAPMGATWYFDRQEMVPYDAFGYAKFTVERDTLIDSKTMKVISEIEMNSDSVVSFLGNTFIYLENSKVYRLVDNELVLVYDFALNPSDTLGVNVRTGWGCDSVSPIVLDSIGISISDFDTVKVQYLSYNRWDFDGSSKWEKISYEVLEKIGDQWEVLSVPVCELEAQARGYLRCYQDNEIQYVGSFWNSAAPCDEIINKVSITENLDKNFVSVYPNPVIDFLIFDFNDKGSINCSIELYTLLGKKLMETKNCTRVDMQHFPKGVFLVHVIKDNNNQIFKIIKQ